MYIYVSENADNDRARLIAERINGEVVYENPETDDVYLCLNENGLWLTDGVISMNGDFERLEKRIRKSNLQNEILVKAARFKGVSKGFSLADATAGMGEDSFVLASAGFNVTMFERDRVIASLLEDALLRASKNPLLAPITERMKLIIGDSTEELCKLNGTDVILLDPMFPERQKSSLVKKKFQLLHRIEPPCTDEKQLLEGAINAKPKKIVIKRPVKSPYLAEAVPSYSIKGDSIRADVILI